MRRTWILLVTGLLVAALAAPASAKKGGNKPAPGDEPLRGRTCEETQADYDVWGAVSFAESGSFVIENLGAREWACFDVTAPAGTWTVTAEVSGMRGITLAVQDSVAPGDSCWRYLGDGLMNGTYSSEAPGMPDPYVNACGGEQEGGYGEWADGFPYPEAREDIDSPLAFVVFAGNGRGATATITVDIVAAGG